MGAAIHDDVALPALALTDVIEDRDAAGRLHDAPKTDAAELGQAAGQAPLGERRVLRAVMAVHARDVVARRRFLEARRMCRIVLAAVASSLLVLAGLGRLQPGD